jgi:protein O-GlcNAc transferase
MDIQLLDEQAKKCLHSQKYEEAIALYEEAIARISVDEPHRYQYYCYLGIALLLQGQEAEAQMVWLSAVADAPEEDTDTYSATLIKILTDEAQYREKISDWFNAWLLSRYICENAPTAEHWLRALGASVQASFQVSNQPEHPQLEPDWEALNQMMQLLALEPYSFPKDSRSSLFSVLEQIKSQYPEAIESFSPDTNYILGNLYRQEAQIVPAIAQYQKALNQSPERIEIYESIIESLIILTNSGLQVYGDWQQLTEIYTQVCRELFAQLYLPASTSLIRSYLMSGAYETALTYFLETERRIYQESDCLTERDWQTLYRELLFFVPFLRDDPVKNSRLFQLAGEKYLNSYLASFFKNYQQFQILPKHLPQRSQDPVISTKNNSQSLRIGIVSGHFRRHASAWCTKDWLHELAQIAPDVRFYLTAKFPADDITQKYEKFSDRFYRIRSSTQEEITAEIIQKLLDDDLDVLIEPDAIMNSLHATVMAAQPAKICISWPGFASPYLSEHNYFLADRHLLPPDIDRYYLEKLLRMPDSYLAVSELASQPIDREATRLSMGIEPYQIVYLSISAGHKFNPETADAIAQILHRVPDSVFLHKGKGDLDLIKATYYQACDLYHVNSDRIKFLPPRTPTEEEHRTTYKLADVLLDSYPYNSCTHSLEAFWQDLPVVTIVGKQMFSRFGYSFFQTLGIEDGIAWNWEEYVEWGERFGRNRDERESVRSHLQRSKQPDSLSALWNPRKFATDLYALLLKQLESLQTVSK